MKIFVSGATGFIGSRLCLRLAGNENTVHALYRSEKKSHIINRPGIHLFRGDIMNPESLVRAMQDCEQVYHVAAFTRVWDRDCGRIYRLNIEGTLNVIRAAMTAGVKKIVVTSTAGVFGPSGEEDVNEQTVPSSFFIDYETSKFILEKILSLVSVAGINVVMVNPTRVYGEGPLNDSNGVTKMIDRYHRGKWRFIPGSGKSAGNYVHIDDVVNGHILAMQKGKSGERYILGGENVTYDAFFEILSRVTGRKIRMLHLPLILMLVASGILLTLARLTGGSPMITPALVRKFNKNFRVSSQKAMKELGYEPNTLESGIQKTVEWLNKKKG